MSFDLFEQQQQIAAQIAGPVAAAGIALADTFGLISLAAEGSPPIGAQTVFMKFLPVDEAGRSAAHNCLWSFDLYVDAGRASTAQKTAAATLFSTALAALIGWEIGLTGRFTRTAVGQESGFDGHITRISFGFTIPVYLAG